MAKERFKTAHETNSEIHIAVKSVVDFWKKQFQMDWLKRFEYLYEKTL